MCGINGVYYFNGQCVGKEQLEKMNNKIIHRGPDDEGYYLNNNLGLAMRRLSIIDLKKGHQPIFNEDGSIVVILNGEIYNHIELRQELKNKGHVFKTNCDTEVIAHLFEEKGLDCVLDLNGMFAFAVWDNRKKELYVFRDRIGIKPLFYTVNPECFIFSSDLTALTAIDCVKKEIDWKAFLLYLGMSYVPAPETIYKNIYKLEPGCFLKILQSGKVSKKKYWEIVEFETLQLPRAEDYASYILSLLNDAIRLQMRSDVPVGTFLSGGLDSSTVVALLSLQINQPVRTFSAGFNGGLNELPFAKLISDRFKTEHTELMISEDNLRDVLPQIIDKMDEPLSDNALIPTLLLAKQAIDKGVKVILNGTGGDEIFGGYSRYLPQKQLWRTINDLPMVFRKLGGKMFKRFDFNKGMQIENPELFFIAGISGIDFLLAKKMLRDKKDYAFLQDNLIGKYRKFISGANGHGKQSRMMLFDLNEYLAGDILALLDKMTMAVSLEGRVPLLDHRVVELGFKIPSRVKFSNNRLKGILKDTVKDLLPREIINLPKAGFSGPTHHWVSNILCQSMYRHLIEEPIPLYKEYLDMDVIKNQLAVLKDNLQCAETLFSLYMFNLWYKKQVQSQEIII